MAALFSLDQIDEEVASTSEPQGAVLVSREGITVDGRDAIQHGYRVEEQNRPLVFANNSTISI
jgi:hypothetical protein